MRRYKEEQDRKLISVICNRCGKELKVENGYLKEGCFQADCTFGYFSRKDGSRQQFDLCEDCFDGWVKEFLVPVEESLNTELL